MKFQLPSRRRAIALGLIVFLPVACYLLWWPGLDARDGRHDRRSNGLWMQHGWLGADDWFQRNGKQASRFRNVEGLAAMAEALRSRHITDVFPHLCPCAETGEIAASDAEQVERFLDVFGSTAGERVWPWVGGVLDVQAHPGNPRWRKRFVESCRQLLGHPRLAGVQVNIEPMPSGNTDFLELLTELRRALPEGKKISVAAYPPPTRWQPSPEVHWDEGYMRAVAGRVDQMAVMMYDTSLRSPRLYRQLMTSWTREILDWCPDKEVLLGVPAYEDAGVGYHDPGTENLMHALAGVHAGLERAGVPANYRGVCIYSDWEMTDEKWSLFRERFLGADQADIRNTIP